jgi:Asp-tRNA(Asn)/Glu-tRNA(Gln) amidotransferase B subunit
MPKSGTIELILWLAVGGIAVWIGSKLMKKLKSAYFSPDPLDDPVEMLAKFKEVRRRGDISDKEYKSIREKIRQKQRKDIEY